MMTSGQTVQKHVEQEHRLELGLVQTLLPNTVELTVSEMLKKLRTVTLTLVQVRIESICALFKVRWLEPTMEHSTCRLSSISFFGLERPNIWCLSWLVMNDCV